MKFIDSNVLLYSADNTDARKQRIAAAIVQYAISTETYLISAQVINEFCAVAFRKLKKTVDEIEGFISAFEGIKTVPVLQSWSRRALWIMNRYNLQFYDSLIVAAAEANGCDEILTEDLSDGEVYCGIKAVDPFKNMD